MASRGSQFNQDEISSAIFVTTGAAAQSPQFGKKLWCAETEVSQKRHAINVYIWAIMMQAECQHGLFQGSVARREVAHLHSEDFRQLSIRRQIPAGQMVRRVIQHVEPVLLE